MAPRRLSARRINSRAVAASPNSLVPSYVLEVCWMLQQRKNRGRRAMTCLESEIPRRQAKVGPATTCSALKLPPALPPLPLAAVLCALCRMATSPCAVPEALLLLAQELQQDVPCVARSSIIMGVLQDRLFALPAATDPLQNEVNAFMSRFQELLVQPAAAKLGKCKTPQDKVIAIAKLLRGKLAKAPAHKQPLHTQYLPSALRNSGKRQLDCLGIATAVLALCQQISQQHSQHADLASSTMMVSDDHCWLRLAGAADGNWVQVEVTDPRELQPAQMSNWLYSAGHGVACSAANVVMILVAGMMPEEVNDEAAAQKIRAIQMHMLQQLAQQHPQAMFYSNYFRWGMLHEELELDQLAVAADSGNMQLLQQLALLEPQQLQSQQYYNQSQQLSTGWQWHPSSCAAFGWLNRLQAALCGTTDNLLALIPTATSAAAQHSANPQQLQTLAAVWLHVSRYLLQRALSSVQDCSQVLQKYRGRTGKQDKAADQQLLEAVRDLWQNLADACKAVACLQQLQEHERQLQTQSGQQGTQETHRTSEESPAAGTAAGAPVADTASTADITDATTRLDADAPEQRQKPADGHLTGDAPATASVTGRTVHLGAAMSGANLEFSLTNQLDDSSWLQTLLCFMDALSAYYGDESTDLSADVVGYFVDVAATFTRAVRAEAMAAVAEQLHSSRMKSLADTSSVAGSAWLDIAPGLQQHVQMPSSRKQKRKEI